MNGGGGLRSSSTTSGVRKTIQNIKEITGNHSEDEIYAMLKECSLDPNETAQKLLLQDTFHEVKRKRDRRKENANNRESLALRARPGTQGRGIRSWGNFSPHRVLHDNGTNQVTEKGVASLPASQETKTKEKSSGTSSAPVIVNGPTSVASGTTSGVNDSPSSTGSGSDRINPCSGGTNNLGSDFSSESLDKGVKVTFGSWPMPSTSDCSGYQPASSSAVSFSSSDPILVPSNDSQFPGSAVATKPEVGSQLPKGELIAVDTPENKLTADSESGSSSVQSKIQGEFQGAAKNHPTEVLSSSAVTHGSSSASRPSSNYSSQLQQQSIGLQKAGSNKEWNPKPTNTVNQNYRFTMSQEGTWSSDGVRYTYVGPCLLELEFACNGSIQYLPAVEAVRMVSMTLPPRSATPPPSPTRSVTSHRSPSADAPFSEDSDDELFSGEEDPC